MQNNTSTTVNQIDQVGAKVPDKTFTRESVRGVPTLAELNRIQAEWMAVDSIGPKDEIDRVCRLYDLMPKVYVSKWKDGYTCGAMFSEPVTFEKAREVCKALKGRLDVVWNSETGIWCLAKQA